MWNVKEVSHLKQGLQQQLAHEKDTRQHELSALQDAQTHKIAQLRKKHKEEVTELKAKIQELEWGSEGWEAQVKGKKSCIKMQKQGHQKTDSYLGGFHLDLIIVINFDCMLSNCLIGA